MLPSANTFDDALYQARIAEEQERQLSDLHRRDQGPSRQFTPQKRKPPSPPAEDKVGDPSGTSSRSGGAQQQSGSDAKPQQRPYKVWKCRKCFGVGHKAKDCPQRDPPTETPARVSTSMVTASRPALGQTEESLEQRCQRLRKELADAELQRMTSAYNDHIDVNTITGDVKTVAGAVGPLYYADVQVAGTSVKALLDSGSSATIMSFELFKTIGKAANIPADSLLPVDWDLTLKDYSQRTIPVGAKVHLEIGWKDRSTTVPVYLADTQGEPCLLGTNAVMPLGLMTPDSGVEATGPELEGSKHGVRLISVTRVPSRSSAVLTARVDNVDNLPILFEPNAELMEESGLQLDDALIQPDAEGRVYLLAHNLTSTPQKLKPKMLLGHVESYESDQQIEEGPGIESPPEGNGPVTEVARGPVSEYLCRLLKSGSKDVDDGKRTRLEHQLKICEEGRTKEEVASLKECTSGS